MVAGIPEGAGETSRDLLVRLEQTELGVFRLFGLSARRRLPDLLDLHQLAGTRRRRADRDFSLQLLPSLLETKRAAAVQRFAVDGYASVERRGRWTRSCPASWPTTRRSSPSGRCPTSCSTTATSDRTRATTIHGILIDASASMRGVREVVARGLALALAKKLALLGGEVWLRFFDSRLHRRVEAGRPGRARSALPALLSLRAGAQLRPRVRGAAHELGRPGASPSGARWR